MKRLFVALLLAWAGLANAQIGNFPALLGARGTSLPSTCQIGQLFFKTDVTAGSNIYGCTAANTWTVSSFNSSTFPTLTGTPAAGDLSYWTGASTQALLTPNGSLLLGGSSSAPTNYAGSTVTAGQFGNAIGAAGALTGATLSAKNAQTGTYQVLAADFTSYKTITVASGTFTITLVASGTQPADGQYIRVLNYGSGVVTIARSGQNINGGTTSLTLPAGSATAPTSAFVMSDGTNYFADVKGSASAGFDAITTGSNTTATMTVGTGGTITVSGSGVNNANQFKGNSTAAVADGGTGATTAQAASQNLSTRYFVYQQGLPLLFPGTGTTGVTGDFTLGTAITNFPTKAYCYFPANTINSGGSAAGWYYCTMSSSTAGQMYTDTYTPSSTPPTVPGSPTAPTAAANWTGVTSATTGASFSVPANSLGLNGEVLFEPIFTTSTNNANSKSITLTFGSTTTGSVSLASATTGTISGGAFRNTGATNANLAIAAAATPVKGTEDTTSAMTVTLSVTHGTATDNVLVWPFAASVRKGN